MFSIDKRVRHLAAGALLALFTCLPALADDAEIYQSQASETAQPNVLFVIDTSGSMNTDVNLTPAPFDQTKTYASQGCDPDRIYFSRGTDAPGDCRDDTSIPRSEFFCAAASAALVNIGGSGSWPALGLEIAEAAQFRVHGNGNGDKPDWGRIRGDRDGPVDCQADEGVHGQTSGSDLKFIANGDDGPWTSAPKNLWDTLTSQTYRFYTANYMNWLNGPAVSSGLSRLEIVRDVALNLASSLTDVNLGLMRYSSDAQGGYVLEPVLDIATHRDAIINSLSGNDFVRGAGGGNTPLSETFYEASLYLQGQAPDYGTRSTVRPGESNPTSIKDGKYISPIQFTCQKNYIVYLTDGAPTSDDDANGKIETMIGKACANQTEPFHDDAWTPGSGICMDELAAWMADDQNTDLAPTVDQHQNAQTYMIGFGDSLASTKPYLDAIAAAGGTGSAYTATDVSSLTAALRTIFSDLQQDSGTFVTPSISVNAFNRAQTDNDLFFSLFKVGKRQHWDGNLKKYALVNNQIVDSTGAVAVNANGFFADGTTSYWSAASDGSDVTIGGAVSRLPAPDSRKLVTSVAGNNLLGTAGNAIKVDQMTDALFCNGAATT